MKIIKLCWTLLLISATLCSCVPPPRETGVDSDHASVTEMETRMFNQINRERQKSGLGSLQHSARLQELARSQSRDMAQHHYLAHVDSQGRDLQARFAAARLENWRTIGENVARSMGYDHNDEVMVKGWLNSKHHRDNIMNGEYEATGMGVIQGADGIYYATQIFMRAAK